MDLGIIRVGATLLCFASIVWWAFHPSWSFLCMAVFFALFALPLLVKEADDRNNQRVHERAQVTRGATPGLPMTNHTQAPFGPPPVVQQQPAMPPSGNFSPNYDLKPE